jgi:hypothetical protein
LKNNMTIPMPGWDSNPLMINEKKYWGESRSNGVGFGGLGGLTFDGTGLLGTGLFSGDITTWGVSELIAGAIGAYAIYAMFFQAKQTKYRLEAGARRRRVGRASRLRQKAKQLEEQTEGIF